MSVVPAGISRGALQRLQALEGSVPYVYDDGDGTWPKRKITSYRTRGHPTIGVGHLIRKSEHDRFRPYLGARDMPQGEILALLNADVHKISAPIRAKVQVPVTQAMWDALVIHAFNVGPYASSVKRAIQAINQKDWKQAQRALATGATTSKGKTLSALVKRRAEEASLFLSGGLPGTVQNLRTAGRNAIQSTRRHRRNLRRLRKRKVILTTAALIFASISVAALLSIQQNKK